MPRRRPKTDLYLAAVEDAVAQPGKWIEVPRDFDTEFNASITGSCLGGGYLRVQPQEGDVPVTVRGKRYIQTAAPVEPRVRPIGDKWRLSIRSTPATPDEREGSSATAPRTAPHT